MNTNLIRRSAVVISMSAALLFVNAATVWALPPKPGGPKMPAQGGQPQFPSQPEIPPCAECDEFLNEKTPEPSTVPSAVPSATPTATPKPEEDVTSNNSDNEDNGGDNGGGSSSGVGGNGGEVLSLSTTAGEDKLVSLATVIGFICLGLGVKLYNRKIKSVLS